jgi:hypothetical protein
MMGKVQAYKDASIFEKQYVPFGGPYSLESSC